VVVGGLLFVIGGVTDDPLNFRAYNPATNTWDSNRAQMPTMREHIAAAVVNNKIYVIAGRWGNINVATVEEYDPATNVWTTKASIPTARSGITCGVINGKIHVTGGEDQLNLNIYNQHEVYDPATNTWATLPALPAALHGHASGVVNGLWYNIGGFRAVGVNTFESLTNGTEVYTP
jgi:N-acetylneuraminic acid mutarotase